MVFFQVKLAPSILSADFSRMGEAVAEATRAGADAIHVDVMDGQFVPTVTFGPQMVKDVRSWTDLPLDVHLMVVEPDRLISQFVEAGADIITVHIEACTHLHRVIHQIKSQGVKASVALNPGTPMQLIEEVLPDLDQVLIMSVNPGFPGQKFIPSVIPKIVKLRNELDRNKLPIELEVDGGVTEATAPLLVKAGASSLVAGSSVFNKRESVEEAMNRLRKSVSLTER
jgi:ribulose-phosphate 3-epimerase